MGSHVEGPSLMYLRTERRAGSPGGGAIRGRYSTILAADGVGCARSATSDSDVGGCFLCATFFAASLSPAFRKSVGSPSPSLTRSSRFAPGQRRFVVGDPPAEPGRQSRSEQPRQSRDRGPAAAPTRPGPGCRGKKRAARPMEVDPVIGATVASHPCQATGSLRGGLSRRLARHNLLPANQFGQ
jgi:hypothetical protein